MVCLEKPIDWERRRALNAVDCEMGLTGSEVVFSWRLQEIVGELLGVLLL